MKFWKIRMRRFFWLLNPKRILQGWCAVDVELDFEPALIAAVRNFNHKGEEVVTFYESDAYKSMMKIKSAK